MLDPPLRFSLLDMSDDQGSIFDGSLLFLDQCPPLLDVGGLGYVVLDVSRFGFSMVWLGIGLRYT